MIHHAVHRHLCWALPSLLLFPLGTYAQADNGMADEPFSQDITAAAPLPISIDVGVDFVTAYWWQGYLYENKGLIAQPYLELGMPLRDAGDGGPAIDIYFGWWSSLHSA